MIKFLFIIALLYVLFFDLKLTRHANQSTKKIIRGMIYGLILLIASLYLRTDSLGSRSSIYIALIYGLSPFLTIVAVLLLLRLILKYRKELLQTIRELIKSKWNIVKIAVLTGLLIATAIDASLWSFIVAFAVSGVLIIREAFIAALNRNKEARA